MRILYTYIVLICSISFAQTSLDNTIPKHQIGIGISKFVNSAFTSDKNAYSINYRYALTEKIHVRAGALYEKDDSEGGFTDFGIKLGADKIIKNYTKWHFYYGIDVMTNYNNYKNINKNQYMLGIMPFLGIQFNLSQNFSFTVEPGFYVRHNIVVDHATFSNDNRNSWTESGLGKLGYVNLNFHF